MNFTSVVGRSRSAIAALLFLASAEAKAQSATHDCKFLLCDGIRAVKSVVKVIDAKQAADALKVVIQTPNPPAGKGIVRAADVKAAASARIAALREATDLMPGTGAVFAGGILQQERQLSQYAALGRTSLEAAEKSDPRDIVEQLKEVEKARYDGLAGGIQHGAKQTTQNQSIGFWEQLGPMMDSAWKAVAREANADFDKAKADTTDHIAPLRDHVKPPESQVPPIMPGTQRCPGDFCFWQMR
jgi:hypothetical protein